ncbi:hypothetical protein L1987_29990 [Smallanthus sonchifolius]|uniref:Uncharacterized protein n=1 Tax=Smallanthus sonchifolius TaxID=185202 RepID=A0ACB9I2R7_9ASTR|nr:hypothetical protein L1987_29990 [Smallanthus sonchifolius]
MGIVTRWICLWVDPYVLEVITSEDGKKLSTRMKSSIQSEKMMNFKSSRYAKNENPSLAVKSSYLSSPEKGFRRFWSNWKKNQA